MQPNAKLRVAMVGCGQIAWIHLSHVTRFQLGEVVGICDFYKPQVQKTGQAFGVTNLYTDLEQMLSEVKPNVVHIATPPPTHSELSIRAMRAGCHVLVEKPMALSVEEADRMIAVSRETNKRLCVDHNRLFSAPALEARRLLESGELGDLVSVDFFQGFGLPPRMRRAEVEGQWWTKLPGGLVQDLAPHCIYSLLEFTGLPLHFNVLAKKTGAIPGPAREEVRLMVEGERVLGTGTISCSAQPFANYLTLYGTKGTARVNIDNFTLVLKKNRYSHPLFNRVFGTIEEGRSIFFGSAKSTLKFATGKLPRYPDILELIRRYYQAIQHDHNPPVTPEQGRETVRLIAEVVAAVRGSCPRCDRSATAVMTRAAKPSRILVTGATGFLGKALLRRFLARGASARALARPSMRVPELEQLGVDVVVGDAADRATAEAAMHGVEAVIHCAGRMGSQGTWDEFYRDSVESTMEVLQAASEAGVKRVIYVSSLGIYGMPQNGNRITEETPWERYPEKRGNYSRAKIEAEKLAAQFARERGLPLTVFRPGIIYGRGRALPTAPLAFPSPVDMSFMVIGSSHTLLPLNYIENLVDAFELALEHPQSVGKQYNIVDDETLTSGEYHRIRGELDGTRAIFVPSFPFRLAAPAMAMAPRRIKSGKLVNFSPYALAGALKNVKFDTTAVRRDLCWQPRVALAEAIKAALS